LFRISSLEKPLYFVNNPQADSLIEKGRPLKELAELFPDKVSACEYFARSMSARFSSPEPRCVMCHRTCDEAPVRFNWRANLHNVKTILLSFLYTALAIFAHHLYSRWIVVEFTTVHRLCASCQRRHRHRRVFMAILQKFLFVALILLLILTVPLVIFFFVAMFAAPEGIRVMLAGAVTGLGLLVLVAWAFEGCRKRLIPSSLRGIGRFPFFLFGIDTASRPPAGGGAG
jgi:hypothetical protein